MEKSIEGNGLFLEKFDDNNVYISNSFTNYIFNIRNGTKTHFDGITPKKNIISLKRYIFQYFIFIKNIFSFMIFHYLHQYMNLL